MKRLIFTMMLVVTVLLALNSCEERKKNTVTEEPVVTTILNVERAISMDKEYMTLNYGGDYRWYETCILMKDFMDEETTGEVKGITSIFQVVREHAGGGADTKVIMISHTKNADTIEVIDGFWVEDFPMNTEEINLTYIDAFNRAMETNCIKPHSQHCVLRKEVGPKNTNVQYIFGNRRCQVYVDAVTGDVSNHDPVFINGPLGEWP